MSNDTLEKLIEHFGKPSPNRNVFIDQDEVMNHLWQLKKEQNANDRELIQALTDPENQPSQFGTVPLEWYENLENKLEKVRFNVGEVIDSLDGSYEKHAKKVYDGIMQLVKGE